MDRRIEKIKKFREFLLARVATLSPEQLNRIPEGFSNNIIWNLAHLVSAQQGICYLRAGQPAVVSDRYIAPFSTNTKPERFIHQEEIEEIRALFTGTIYQLDHDYEKKLFANYTASPNIARVYGIELTSIDDALEFLLYHEGHHAGVVLSLALLVG